MMMQKMKSEQAVSKKRIEMEKEPKSEITASKFKLEKVNSYEEEKESYGSEFNSLFKNKAPLQSPPKRGRRMTEDQLSLNFGSGERKTNLPPLRRTISQPRLDMEKTQVEEVIEETKSEDELSDEEKSYKSLPDSEPDVEEQQKVK